VPSADLGRLGPHQGEAISYNWKGYYSASGFVIWLALILAIVIPKDNHNIHVLWIVVPLVVLNRLWSSFNKITGMSSSSAIQFDTVFRSMLIGIAVLWLIVNYFKRSGGFIRFLLSFVTVVLVAGLGTLSYSTEFSNETTLFLAVFAFITFGMLTAIVITRKLCKGKYRPVCFLLWLALWTLICSIFATMGFLIVGSLIMSSGPDFFEATTFVILVGSILGLSLYVLNLPFLILGFAHPFFRERLCACLNLRPQTTTAKSETGLDQIPNQQSPI